MRQFFIDIIKVVGWVKTSPMTYDRIRNGCECRVTDYRYNAAWRVTRGRDKFDIAGQGMAATLKEAKKAALSVANHED